MIKKCRAKAAKVAKADTFSFANLATFARNCFATGSNVPESVHMDAPNENASKPKYQWPWFVLAAVLLGIVLAVLWVGAAAKKVERQRDYNAPLPDTAPAR